MLNFRQKKVETGLNARRDLYITTFPTIEPPKPVGCYSVNSQRLYEPNSDQLRYYRPPSDYPLDLNIGWEKANKKPASFEDELIDHLLRYIHDNHNELMDGDKKQLKADFVSFRGLLRLVMCTPYEQRQDWCIQVIRFKNTHYMVERDTLSKKRQREKETVQQKKMFSWGFKFEQYCLSSHPAHKPQTNVPVDECPEFTAVFLTKMAKMDLLYGAEVDGVLSDKPIVLQNADDMKDVKFVELKTRQGINVHPRQKHAYQQYKTRNWWCQSFLVGINKLFVGLRDERGLVQKIELIDDMRSLRKEGENHWSANTCAEFLVKFLKYVRQLMMNIDCPYTVFEFYYDVQSGNILYERYDGKSVHSFLPDWYIPIFETN